MNKLTHSLSFNKKNTGSFKWYHGALFFAGITLVERGLEKLSKKINPRPVKKDDKVYYKELHQPVFAPPAKAFPIAWEKAFAEPQLLPWLFSKKK